MSSTSASAPSDRQDCPDAAQLRQRLRELRVRVQPVRRRILKDAATFIVLGSARRDRRKDTSDEPSFVEIPINNLPPSITLRPLHLPEQATPSTPMTTPPTAGQHLPDAMPKSTEAWQRAAQHHFEAGTHGPVEFPSDNPLPLPAQDSVFLASNYRSTSTTLTPENRAFLARKTAKELLTGAIERVTRWDQVAAILTVFVVVSGSEGKQRIIFDARALNRLLTNASGSVRYESVRDALVDAACCTKLDIASAFRHVSVAEHHRRYLCFEVEGVLYRYKTLPFGVSWSPALFYKALEPTIRKIRRSLPPSARIVWYVDDLLIVADNTTDLDTAVSHTIDSLLHADWAVSPEKTFPQAYHRITFLGLTADYSDTTATLRVPDDKAARIRSDALSLASSPVVRVHQLQGIAGRLEFVGIVVPMVGFLRRGLDAAVADGLRSLHGCVPMVDRLRADLLAIGHAAQTFGQFSLSSRDSIVRRQIGIVYSDASAVGWGALHLHPDAPCVDIPPELSSEENIRAWTTGDLFTVREQTMSSGAREVRAIVAAVTKLNLRNGDVAWHSDATVAVSAISLWRTRSDDVATALAELWDLCRLRDLRLSISHVLRDAELMPVADWLSRRGWRDRQAEWGFDLSDVTAICRALGVQRLPSADLFASLRNAVVKPFCSRWAEPGAIGDAFFVDWASTPDRLWWAFPPHSLLPRLCHRLIRYIRAGEQSRQLTPFSTSRPCPGRWSIILVYPIFPDPPTFLSELLHFAARDVLVHVSGDSSTYPHHSSASTPVGRKPVCQDFRLLAGDRRPAPEPPPWSLRAALFHVDI